MSNHGVFTSSRSCLTDLDAFIFSLLGTEEFIVSSISPTRSEDPLFGALRLLIRLYLVRQKARYL